MTDFSNAPRRQAIDAAMEAAKNERAHAVADLLKELFKPAAPAAVPEAV